MLSLFARVRVRFRLEREGVDISEFECIVGLIQRERVDLKE